jgi:hypothetical protein
MRICVIIPTNAPYITKVSVEETDTQNGEMQVEMRQNLRANRKRELGPYTYIFPCRWFSGTQNYTQLNSFC